MASEVAFGEWQLILRHYFDYVNMDGCSFTDNPGLCGIPGLPTCGIHLSAGAKVGIDLGACVAFLLIVTGSVCWWKRRQNIIRSQQIAGKLVHSNWLTPELYVIGGLHTFLDLCSMCRISFQILQYSLFRYWSARYAPYAKARTTINRGVQMTRATRQRSHENNSLAATETGPS